MNEGNVKNYLKWAAIENIALIIAMCILFYLTRSGWCFLLVFFCNSLKINKSNKEDENIQN